MENDLTPAARNLTTPYKAVAVYYEDADTVEYIRDDVAAIFHRVDPALTLIFDMKNREKLIGFQVKGFRNFYLKDEVRAAVGDDFLSLVGILERLITAVGAPLVDGYRRRAYEQARQIALEDGVALHDVPRMVAAR